MQKRPVTPSYIFFYLLFWPDTYRIAFGIIGSLLLTPSLIPPDLGAIGDAMTYFMVACIGYALFAVPAQRISTFLRKQLLKGGPK